MAYNTLSGTVVANETIIVKDNGPDAITSLWATSMVMEPTSPMSPAL